MYCISLAGLSCKITRIPLKASKKVLYGELFTVTHLGIGICFILHFIHEWAGIVDSHKVARIEYY
jgi:hypothetical protein